MTNKEALKILNTIKYKKGWSFFFRTDPTWTFGLIFRIKLDTIHIGTGRPTEIEISHKLRPDLMEHPEELLRTVFTHITNLELHEAREWFMVGDKRPYDPHALEMRLNYKDMIKIDLDDD